MLLAKANKFERFTNQRKTRSFNLGLRNLPNPVPRNESLVKTNFGFGGKRRKGKRPKKKKETSI